MSDRRHGSCIFGGVFARLAFLVLAILFLTLDCARAGVAVGLRVVDETAPPGGLAVVYIELTEPKPLSSGRVRFASGGGPLLQVVGVSLLDAVGQVQANLISTDQGATVEFVSSTATFGTSLDLPIMAVSISVNPTAQPGQNVPITLDLSDSLFLDPQGQPYPTEVQQGVFTVGGVSITDMTPSQGTVAAGGTIQFKGVGFEDGFDLRIDEATVASAQLAAPDRIEVTLGASFQIRPTSRIRLRNPSGSDDLFYPAVVSRAEGGNQPPEAVDDSVATLEDSPLVIDALANDSDPDGDPLTIGSLAQPQHGGAMITAQQKIRYLPGPDYNGSDQFEYTATDGRGGSATATVRVRVDPVNDAPTAVQDLVETAPDKEVRIEPLDNDSDVDGDALTLIQAGEPSHGIAIVEDSGSLIYFPKPLFSGEDQFEYQVSDGRSVTAGSVTVTVRLPNLPPVALDDVSSGVADEPQTISVLDNDSDPNGEALTLGPVGAAAHGTTEALPDGRIVYRPGDGFSGSDDFVYEVRDGTGRSSQAKVVIVVESNPAPVRFTAGPRPLVAGGFADVVATLSEPAAATVEVPLTSSDPQFLRAPPSVTIGEGSESVGFRVYASKAGTGVLGTTLGGGFAGLAVVARRGALMEFPVQGFQAAAPAERSSGTPDSPSLGLALANRGPEHAVVRLRALENAEGRGEVLADLDVNLGPYEQTSRALDQYAPELAGFEGWLEVSSFNSSVSALFLNFNSRLKGLAGTSQATRSTSFVLHCPGLEGVDNFDFSLINNTPDPVLVGLELQLPEHLLATDVILDPQSVAALGNAIGPLCPGVLSVASPLPLAAYQQVATPDYLFGQRPPSVANQSPLLYIPQFVSGLDWFTNVSLSNGNLDTVVSFTLLSDGGPPTTTQLTLDAGETRTLSGRDIFDLDPGQLHIGSVVVEASNDVIGSAVLGRGGDRKIGAAAGVFPRTSTVAIFPQAASGTFQGVDFFTGLALQNPGDVETHVVIDVFSSEGVFRGWAVLRLAPRQRLSKLLNELVPGLGSLGAGHVRVRSTRPLVALEMFGDLQLNFLATVVPAPVPDN